MLSEYVLLKKKVSSRFDFIVFLLRLLHFKELYYNSTIIVYNLKTFLQFEFEL